MNKFIALGLIALVAGCSTAPVSAPVQKETYPYGMTEKEWNELSVKDKANIRRDFYFYEKGSTSFVNPQLEVEGRAETPNVFMQQRNTTQRKVVKPVTEPLLTD